ncbi:hypothetical protein [Polaribacter sp.]|uniref:hypothetical protein n=1 Tax=Polaribacter sp. TaxID=1920175 RepID=UPI003F6CA5A9
MTLRELKRISFYLEALADVLFDENHSIIQPKVVESLTREELINIAFFLYQTDWTIARLELKTDQELLAIIGDDIGVLLYISAMLHRKTIEVLSFSKTEIDFFFSTKGNPIHYLANKETELWDGYDRTNFRSLLSKAGLIRKVFGVYPSSIREAELYQSISLPLACFDTLEEANRTLSNIAVTEKLNVIDLVVYQVWIKN